MSSAELRRFGPIGILAILLIVAGNLLFVPLSALLVLAWAHASHTPWRDLGFVRPQRWVRDLAIGLVGGALFKLVMKALVMPLLGAPATNPTYHYLVGNTAALPATLYLVIIGAGFGEETLFRGFFFERLRALLGPERRATIAIVLITAILFGAAHLPDQGLFGAEQATIVGLAFGAIYAITGSLALPMIAHAAFDLTAVAIIYWDLESQIAHLLFR